MPTAARLLGAPDWWGVMPGRGVDLQEIGGPVRRHDKVRPGVHGQPDGPKDGQRRLPQPLLPLRGDLGRADLQGRAGLVLVLVVVEASLGMISMEGRALPASTAT